MSNAQPPFKHYQGLSLADMEARLRKGHLTHSGWLESADVKLPLRDGAPLPWFTYSAIEFLETVVTPDLSVFEFGAGNSTRFWAGRVKQVRSVEHDPAYVDFLRPQLPDNADLSLIEADAPIEPALAAAAAGAPDLPEPERSALTMRRGQVNSAFKRYCLSLLEYAPNTHDIVVVDGMARALSTWAAIRSFRRDGFIIFDNSDRDEYAAAYQLFDEAGYRRIDFTGLGPINPYGWSTSVFYQPAHFTGVRWFPEPRRDEARAARKGLGVLVLGYNRPYHLQSVLESLRQQDALGAAHVWIDGTQGRGEHFDANTRTAEIARRFPVAEVRVQSGHLGIEKMMLDALTDMTRRYDRLIILEDDCFPTRDAVEQFEAALAGVADRADIYSVYGHPFGTEPDGADPFPRFQGWGWAAHSARIEAILPELKTLFEMPEQDYLAHVRDRLTPDIQARLDCTGERRVLNVLKRFYSWDSATAFLCAERGLDHVRTASRTIFNTGIVPGMGHFRADTERVRSAPFNMITLDEAWDHFDSRTPPCPADKDSYGLDGLDLLIADAVPLESGFLIEIGAHDGVTQSNSVILERQGWTGLLVEALPAEYARCRAARPGMIVEHAACVAPDHEGDHLTIIDAGLMSLGVNSEISGEAREDWLSRGEGFAKRARQAIDVPAVTLSSLLDKYSVDQIDLLILDVEGAEASVLAGLDFDRHAPRYIVAEDAYNDVIADQLAAKGYERRAILLERRYTRDCLYSR